MFGVPDDKLINKKGSKFQSDAQVRGVISATLLNDNALTQRGIAEHLHNKITANDIKSS